MIQEWEHRQELILKKQSVLNYMNLDPNMKTHLNSIYITNINFLYTDDEEMGAEIDGYDIIDASFNKQWIGRMFYINY